MLIQGNQMNISSINTNYIDNSFQNSIAETSLGNVKSNQIAVIITFDCIIIVILLGSLIYWKEK